MGTDLWVHSRLQSTTCVSVQTALKNCTPQEYFRNCYWKQRLVSLNIDDTSISDIPDNQTKSHYNLIRIVYVPNLNWTPTRFIEIFTSITSHACMYDMYMYVCWPQLTNDYEYRVPSEELFKLPHNSQLIFPFTLISLNTSIGLINTCWWAGLIKSHSSSSG